MNCILGNLFDNALEALSKVDKKILYFRMVYEKGVVNICLRNMFDGQLRVNEKNQLLSLKQDRKECHGLGIKNVVETVKKYDGKFEYEQEKNVFSVYAMIVACQAKRKKVTRKTQKTALIYPIYGNQSGFSYVI